ncbi:MAG: hypothetical protein K9M98_06780 [Cephaloticoccus sp.]|nr:hypothetical protein [Cephaloticoccus sp.]MCF7760193.1 hypothetical protein [Cephaloticoccus sp.]
MSILPSDTPRLPKWPFLIGDAVLLGCAVLLAKYSPLPYANPVIIAIAGCVALAAILGVLPFLTDYAGKQDEALDERQRGLEALTRTVADSAEQISVAATSLHELTEVARQQLAQAEALPDKLDDSIRDFNEALAKSMTEATESLHQEIKTLRASESRKLDATLHRIQETLVELKQTASVAPAASMGVKPQSIPANQEPTSNPKAPVASGVEPTVVAEATLAAASAVESVTSKGEHPGPSADSEAIEAAVEVTPKPVRKSPSPKKTKPSEPVELPLATPMDPAKEFSLSDVDSSSGDLETKPRSIASDGATRLFVTAYIGIGNRLFLRGDGAGLNTEKGVPLQFVSIGKWQWETKDAAEPLHVRLYKNDEIECLSPGELILEPGHQVEVSASF